MTNFGLNFFFFFFFLSFKILISEFPVFCHFYGVQCVTLQEYRFNLLYDTAVIKFVYTVPCRQRGDLSHDSTFVRIGGPKKGLSHVTSELNKVLGRNDF